MNFEVDTLLYVNYGDNEWHQRLILGHIAAYEYMVVTPTYDFFVEQIGGAGADIETVRLGVHGGGLPLGIDANDVFGFNDGAGPTAAERRQLLGEGQTLTEQERAARGLAGAGGAPGVPPGAVVVGPVAPMAGPPGAIVPAPVALGVGAPPGLPPPGVAPPVPAPPAVAPPGGVWVVDEPTETNNVGDLVALPPGAAVLGTRALVAIGGEIVALKRLDPGTDLAAYSAARKALLSDDMRVIPLKTRGFAEAAAEMTASAVATPLTGPRSADWLVTEISRSGGGMVSRHMRWRRESGVKSGDRIIFEHEVVSRAVEYAATHDAYNIRNSVSMEFLLRRLQLLEEAVAENLEQPSYDGAKHYLGVEERKGGALMAPALRAHVASELQRETAILKEKRKAREARGGGRGPMGQGRGEAV